MRDSDDFIVTLISVLIAIIIVFVSYSVNADQWNDGYCSCGGRWVYQEAVGHRYSTNYIYKCDNCGKVKEFYSTHEETNK